MRIVNGAKPDPVSGVGRTTYHCHIIDHEDLGMMGVIEMRA
jgi:FtsP/CotA-like multicopper oxidase with cupredoxin domain